VVTPVSHHKRVVVYSIDPKRGVKFSHWAACGVPSAKSLVGDWTHVTCRSCRRAKERPLGKRVAP
jgi:hypothetical protein